jgi:hypothetical protein
MSGVAHMVGDLVRSLVNAQGLAKGQVYQVDDVTVRDMAFGRFVTYWLKDDNGHIYGVNNGHLLLAQVTA